MAEDRGAPEAGQLPTAGPEFRVQNAVRMLSTECFEYKKNSTECCVRCSEDERAHSERDEGAQVPQWKSKELVCQ